MSSKLSLFVEQVFGLKAASQMEAQKQVESSWQLIFLRIFFFFTISIFYFLFYFLSSISQSVSQCQSVGR
jgi:hypothetical protein